MNTNFPGRLIDNRACHRALDQLFVMKMDYCAFAGEWIRKRHSFFLLLSKKKSPIEELLVY
jgi:hypothetical protein